MTDITNFFGGEPYKPEKQRVDAVEVQVAEAMKNAGIEPPANIIVDGNLHRFSTNSRKKDDSGWYVIFQDGVPAGRFGCWRDNIEVSFRADIGRELTSAEQMALTRRQFEAQKARDEARQRKAEIAANTVEAIWSTASAADKEHPYLKRKGINSNGARITGDSRLIVPLYNCDELSSLQYIDTNGGKLYHPGGITKGCSFVIGELTDGPIFVAEGFATAATIHEVSGHCCVAAYSASNLSNVVGQLRERYGNNQPIVVVADNDKSGVGRNEGEKAIAKHGGRLVVPPEEGDANDYHLAGGNLMDILFPPVSEWLKSAVDFSSKPSPIKWYVKHWLQANALIMVHGPSGAGKSFIVLDMIMHIASDADDWMRNKVKNGPIVYLAGEGHYGLKGRIAAWMQHHGRTPDKMHVSMSGCDLNTPEGYQKVVEAVRNLPETPKIIVVDTLHRFLNGDENSATDAKTMLDACSALMEEFDCSVLLVHHTGISAEAQHRARGSSAWKGALDIEISVVPPARESDSITIVQRKAKDTEQADHIFVDLHSVPIDGWYDEDGDQVRSAVIVAGKEPDKAKVDKDKKYKAALRKMWKEIPDKEFIDGYPYLTKAFIVENGGNKKWFESDTETPRQIDRLEIEGWLERSGHGVILKEPGLAVK